jgi:hypothetical protein
MRFTLHFSVPPRIFIPYTTHKRHYHLLVPRKIRKGTDLYVTDSADYTTPTFFNIGDIHEGGYEGDVVGHIFFAFGPIMSFGTSIMAYSKVWAKAVNFKEDRPATSTPSNLVLRGPVFYLYHTKNEMTLAVSPTLPKAIQSNIGG